MTLDDLKNLFETFEASEIGLYSIDDIRLITKEAGLDYSDVFIELIFKLVGKKDDADLDMLQALEGLAALHFVGF